MRKLRPFLAVLFLALSVVMVAQAGPDTFGNGSGSIESTFVYAWFVVPRQLQTCFVSNACALSPTEMTVLKRLATNLVSNPQSRLVFSLPKETGFAPFVEGNQPAAMYVRHQPNTPIYFNVAALYQQKIIGLLLVEKNLLAALAVQNGLSESSAWEFGQKISQLLNSKQAFADLAYYRHPELLLVATSASLVATDSLTIHDLTPQILPGLYCPNGGNTKSLINAQYLRLAQFGGIGTSEFGAIFSGALTYKCASGGANQVYQSNFSLRLQYKIGQGNLQDFLSLKAGVTSQLEVDKVTLQVSAVAPSNFRPRF